MVHGGMELARARERVPGPCGVGGLPSGETGRGIREAAQAAHRSERAVGFEREGTDGAVAVIEAEQGPAVVAEGHIGWVRAGFCGQARVVQEFQASIRLDVEAGDRCASGICRVNIAAVIGEHQPTSGRLVSRHFSADNRQASRFGELVGGDRAAIRGAGGGLGNEETIATADRESEGPCPHGHEDLVIHRHAVMSDLPGIDHPSDLLGDHEGIPVAAKRDLGGEVLAALSGRDEPGSMVRLPQPKWNAVMLSLVPLAAALRT